MTYRTTTEEEIQRISAPLISLANGPPFRFVDYERFKAKFGVMPDLCALIWNRIVVRLNRNPPRIEGFSLSVLHVLYALFFLKVYPTVRQAVTTLGRSVGMNQFRKAALFVVQQIAALSSEVVSDKGFFLILVFLPLNHCLSLSTDSLVKSTQR